MNEQKRPIYEIAAEIYRTWKPVHPTAKPYLEAMQSLDKVTDNYGLDSGKGIISYFLCNAGQYKGEDARRIKAELKSIVGLK